MVISLVNQKGGVGKTTIAVNLASCLSGKGDRLILIDADPQGSVLQWQTAGDSSAFDVIHHAKPLSGPDLKALVRGYQHAVIDAPPALGEIIRSTLMNSELVIVPIGPSPLDIWSSKETLSLIQQVGRRRRRMKAKLLICRKIARTRVGREAREAMETYDLDVFDTEISQRIAYVEAMISGLSVLEYAPRSEAAGEIRRLCEEVRA
jgi:chromosome partitioning protein